MPTDRVALRAGGIILALLGGLALAAPDRLVAPLREAALDRLLAATAPAPSGKVVVIAIDAAALQRFGPWPWPRARLAAVVERLAQAQPRVLVLDLVLSGADRAGPANLSQGLAGLPGAEAALALPDGDVALSRALKQVPVVLAAALSDVAAPPPPLVPVLSAGAPQQVAPWAAIGLEAPPTVLAGAAAGIGVAALAGEGGGLVRRAPLLVLAGDAVAPGLAAEALRVAGGAAALRLGAGSLALADAVVPLGHDASLRLRPTDPAEWPARSLALGDALERPADLAGKIAILGLIAPEAATLRPTALTPLASSVQIQADAVETLLAPDRPLRPLWAGWAEAVGAAVLSLLALLAAARLTPPVAALATAGLASLGVAMPLALFLRSGLLLDPASPALLAILVGTGAIAAALLAGRRRAAALRRRFERHLAPAVVERIAANPSLGRLPGEARIVTALFTDLEGFTARADALPPETLIAILDRYFEGLAAIVHRHGGMIEKFVGDAAHVLFNAPFDLPDHPAKALACALDLAAFGARFAEDPRNTGLGQTRIGLECGPVVVGEVGAGEKLDYTAHGRAMNLAARLEQAGKDLGRGILVGPGLHEALPRAGWEALGDLALKGLGRVPVYAPTEASAAAIRASAQGAGEVGRAPGAAISVP